MAFVAKMFATVRVARVCSPKQEKQTACAQMCWTIKILAMIAKLKKRLRARPQAHATARDPARFGRTKRCAQLVHAQQKELSRLQCAMAKAYALLQPLKTAASMVALPVYAKSRAQATAIVRRVSSASTVCAAENVRMVRPAVVLMSALRAFAQKAFAAAALVAVCANLV